MDKVSKETLERYLSTSDLDEKTKQELRAEFEQTNGVRQVFNKAVTLNGRKASSKVPSITRK